MRCERKYQALRLHIDMMLAEGWILSGRDPVRLERRGRVKLVLGGELIDG